MARPLQPAQHQDRQHQVDVPGSYVFLACDDASFMSGQVLHPNGGTIVAS